MACRELTAGPRGSAGVKRAGPRAVRENGRGSDPEPGRIDRASERIGGGGSIRADRDAAIVRARARGETLEAIGRRHGLSKQRVSQILRRDGGKELDMVVGQLRRRHELEKVAANRHRILAAFAAGDELPAIARGAALRRSAVEALINAEASAADRAARRHARRPRSHRRLFSDEELLDAIRLAYRHGEGPVNQQRYVEIASRLGLASRATIVIRFDSWNAAVEAAGLTPTQTRRRQGPRRWTEERCLEALRALARELGGLPTASRYRELLRDRDDLPSPTTVRIRLGEWSAMALRLAAEGSRPDQREPGPPGLAA